jgi:hypothetical protein
VARRENHWHGSGRGATMLAIPFFDSHLPRRLVELEDAEVANRLFPAT